MAPGSAPFALGTRANAVQLQPGKILVAAPPLFQVQLLDTGRVLDGVVQPTITGSLLGYIWIPAVGDRVIIAYWADATPFILCGLSARDRTIGDIPIGLPGEQFLYGPTGNVLKMIQSGSIEAGNPTNPYKAVVLTGDSVSVSGSVPSGGGSFTATGTVTASSLVLKGN